MKSKVTAILLAFFLGGLGAHHFYLRNTTIGVIYLLFCWTTIPAWIALIEAIILLFQSKAEFDAQYNKSE